MLFHLVMLNSSSIILVILLQSSKKNIQAFFVCEIFYQYHYLCIQFQ